MKDLQPSPCLRAEACVTSELWRASKGGDSQAQSGEYAALLATGVTVDCW